MRFLILMRQAWKILHRPSRHSIFIVEEVQVHYHCILVTLCHCYLPSIYKTYSMHLYASCSQMMKNFLQNQKPLRKSTRWLVRILKTLLHLDSVLRRPICFQISKQWGNFLSFTFIHIVFLHEIWSKLSLAMLEIRLSTIHYLDK